MGAWISYGLGSLNENLPTFVVLPDARGFAPNGPANWSAGLPARRAPGHDGPRRHAEPDLRSVSASKRGYITPESETERAELCSAQLNREHRGARARATRAWTRASPPTNWPPSCS